MTKPVGPSSGDNFLKPPEPAKLTLDYERTATRLKELMEKQALWSPLPSQNPLDTKLNTARVIILQERKDGMPEIPWKNPMGSPLSSHKAKRLKP